MAYLVMALALFADEDYEEVAARLAGTLRGWGGWEESWGVPTLRRDHAGPAAARPRADGRAVLAGRGPGRDLDTAGAFLGPWRLMSIDGMEWDVPDTPANAAAFGSPGPAGTAQAAFPKVRVVTVSECASHAPVLAAIGPCAAKGSGEQSLARRLTRQLEEDWLLIADRNFYNWQDWCAAAGTGAALLWRVKSDIRLPVLELLPDGSYRSVLVSPKATGTGAAGAHRGRPAAARTWTRTRPGTSASIEYEVPDRDGDGKDELIALVTTITDPRQAPAAALARPTTKDGSTRPATPSSRPTCAAPARSCGRQSPDMIEQEIWGYLLTHYAISALICTAATAAGIDPDRVKFKRTVRVIRRRVADPAFSP